MIKSLSPPCLIKAFVHECTNAVRATVLFLWLIVYFLSPIGARCYRSAFVLLNPQEIRSVDALDASDSQGEAPMSNWFTGGSVWSRSILHRLEAVGDMPLTMLWKLDLLFPKLNSKALRIR